MRGFARLLPALAIGLFLPGAGWTQPAKIFSSPATACEACHGRNGNSRQNLIPRINGQMPRYIMRRLDQLGQAPASGWAGPYAKAHGRNMSQETKMQIAAYFARMPPTPLDGEGASSLGVQIYFQGVPQRNVAPCAYCHGAEAGGSAGIPRLAGQHKAYLEIRLDMLSGFLQPGSGAMHFAEKGLTPEEIDAVTSYLAAQ